MAAQVIVGIIGGTGLDQDSGILRDKKLVDLQETPFGWASDRQAISGQIEGVQVYIVSRHGKDHSVNPSHVNYRANLWTLVKQLGCTHILATSACGSLRENLKPGHIGVLDQYFDRTKRYRESSFYKVCHVVQRKPINSTMQEFIKQACDQEHIVCHENLKVVTIEGPRFSTLFESELHRSWGLDLVNMTSVPEVPLATELGVFYATIMLITDYDCWREEEQVNANLVVERMKDLGAKARRILPRIIGKIARHDWSRQYTDNQLALKDSIMVE